MYYVMLYFLNLFYYDNDKTMQQYNLPDNWLKFSLVKVKSTVYIFVYSLCICTLYGRHKAFVKYVTLIK